MNNSVRDSDKEGSQALLQKVQDVLQAEAALTASLVKVEPWLQQSSSQHKLANPHRPRVRPIPTTMDQVEQVLAVARMLSKRTSAPAGWNPNAPVMGFSTPNPLPHQLRGGALAALQLERARQMEREKKRQRIQEQEDSAKASQMEDEDMDEADHGVDPNDAAEQDPKRREVVQHEHQLDRSRSDLARSDADRRAARNLQSQRQAQRQDVSMNLSDSSSSSSSDDDEDD